MLELLLPYPPSVNTYWGFSGSHRFLTAKAKTFKQLVHYEVIKSKTKGYPQERLSLTVHLYPPDRRVRDIDNPIKPLLDSLVQAKLMTDDSQIDRLLIVRNELKKGGQCKVIIETI